MKKTIFTILLLISFNLLSQTTVEFIYNGNQTVSHHLEYTGYITKYREDLIWTTCYQNNRPYACQKLVKFPYQEWINLDANIQFDFDLTSADVGIGTFFKLSVKDGKLSINEVSGKNILALGTSIQYEKTEHEGNITINSKMKVSFKNISTENIFLPVLYHIDSIKEDDGFLNVKVGKVVDPTFFKFILKVSKSSLWGNGKILINRRILPVEMEITPYGDNKSLITIDLEYLLDYLEPGDKYIVEVETRMNMENTFILSTKYAGRHLRKQYMKETLKF